MKAWNGRARALALVLATSAALAAGAATATAADAEAPLVGVVNVNTATAEELQLLPGIGESRARALMELRKSRGGFKSVDELRDVKGIGDGSLEKLRPYVRVTGKTTAQRP